MQGGEIYACARGYFAPLEVDYCPSKTTALVTEDAAFVEDYPLLAAPW